MHDFEVTPVAWVREGRKEKRDDFWGSQTSLIELDERFGEEAFEGIDEFSHLEIVFVFDRVDPDKVCMGARHPRKNEAWPRVGIFAQRGKSRPNRIGVSRCRVIEVRGRTLHVQALDAIEGTPILDIKPWIKEFGVDGPVFQPEWATELMTHYYEDKP